MKTQSWITGALLPGAAFLALAAAPLARADFQSTVLSQDPVGYWRLNETIQPQPIAGAANLGSLGSSALGTYNEFPTRGLTGPFAGSVALGLDGSSQTVTAPYQAALNPATFTIEAWVNPASATVSGGLLCVAASMHAESPRSGWLIYQSDGTAVGAAGVGWYLRLYAQNGLAPSVAVLAPQTVTAGTWTHLVFSFDGTTAKAYINGALVGSGTPSGYVPNPDGVFSIGARSDGGFPWPGQVAEVAHYGNALADARIASHYTTATTTPASYATTVQADSPQVYYRFREPIDPPAANLGSLGAEARGLYIYDASAGVTGPIPPPYTGFEAANKAVSFPGAGGVVRIPSLNLDTNTVTISGWVKAAGAQPTGAGLVLCNGGTTMAGLTIDQVYGGLGLGYVWNGNNYGWSPNADSSLPLLPAGDWAFVALVIQPAQAALFVCDRTNFANFAGATNTFNVNHLNEVFDAPTLFGAESGSTARNFTGSMDEVAIFNRALGAGELYSIYCSAVGAIPPRIFADLLGPVDTVYAGDPLTLIVDAGGTPPLTFTWRKNGTTIGTTTNGVLTVAGTTLLDSGNYDVTISNASGNLSSQPVSVTIVPASAPQITQVQGFQNRTLYGGGTFKAAVTATGGGLKYQWYKNSAAISTATTSSFTIASVAPADAGSYSVSLTNALGTATNGPVVITIPSTSAGSYEALIVASQPQAWWRLNETGGTNMWDGMGRHDGYFTSLIGSEPPVTFGVTGALNNNPDTAVTFTPAKQGVGVVPYSPAINPNVFSVEAWVKTTVATSEIYPLSASYGTLGWYWRTLGGFWNPNNAPIQDNGSPTAGINPGVWTHLVMTYDRARGGGQYPYQYFINGQGEVPPGPYIWEGPGLNTAGPWIIGGHGVSAATLADMFFDGQVDEVAVYPRLLPLSEIQSHFQGRFGTTTPPYFVEPFTSQTVPTGKTVTFSTQVQGSIPITLQWYKDGLRMTGATTNRLTITGTAGSDSGTYTLWATNNAGVASQSVTLTVVPPVSYANVTNELVLHLRFDGNATDTSGRGNNGTPVGSPAFVPGIVGPQALQYTTATNGGVLSASYVNLSRPADLQFTAAASFTIGLWVKLPTNYDGGDLPFIGTAINSMNNPGWDLGPTYGGGGWQWCLNDGISAGIVTNNIDVNDPAGSLTDGAWHNFVLTVDRSAKVATSYLDGVLTATRDITSLGSVDNGQPIIIGQDPSGVYPEVGTATLDDLGIWRRALTPIEVINIYYAASTAGRSFDTVPSDTDVTITVTRSGPNITLSWPRGTLLQSDTLNAGASWTPVAGASAPSYTLTPGTGNKFYRVQVQ